MHKIIDHKTNGIMETKLDKKNIEDIFALSPLQEGMLFHYLKQPGNNAYFEQLCLHIKGDVELDFFHIAWQRVIKANPMLRALFRWEKMDYPVQVILTHHSPEFQFHDLSLPAVSQRDIRLVELKLKDRERSFDLTAVPFRLMLCKMAERQYRMIISNHHILYDGWSNGIILKEFLQAYDDVVTGQPEGKAKAGQYKSFVKWLREIPKEPHLEFWRHYLKGISGSTPLAIKRNNGLATKSAAEPAKAAFLQCQPGEEASCRMHAFAMDHKLTAASYLFSTWGLLLQRYNNTGEAVLGTTIAGREAPVNGIEEIAGLFINTLPLRISAQKDETVSGFFQRCHRQLLERGNHEFSALTDIESETQQGLIDSLVVVENYPLEQLKADSPSLSTSLQFDGYSAYEMTHFDLTLHVTLLSELNLKFAYNPDVYASADIGQLARHFTRLLSYFPAHPHQLIADIELPTAEERSTLLFDFNRTGSLEIPVSSLQALFRQQARRTPDAIALSGMSDSQFNISQINHTQISYRQLSRLSCSLAGQLRRLGAGRGRIIAVQMERSIEMVVAVLGILEAGAAYLPLSPDYPVERSDYILGDCGASICLTNQPPLPSNRHNCRYIQLDGATLLDTEIPWPHEEPAEANLQDNDTPCYIIYTSGSTGKPKGVMMAQFAVLNLLASLQRNYSFGERDVYLLKTSFVFDVSVSELLGWFGGRLAILPSGDEKDPHAMITEITRQGVSHINFVPSMFNLLLNQLEATDSGKLGSLRTIFLAGEALLPELVLKYRRLGIAAKLENLYGPTEAAVYASQYSLSNWQSRQSVFIGKPLHNIRLYNLDHQGRVQPVGVPGELYIGGAGLAKGYLNQPQLTASQFIHQYLNQRLYKTGDLVRWHGDGNLEFLGRMDSQVKVRGFRIEPGEIESRLLSHKDVDEALVTTSTLGPEKNGEDKFLCAYVTLNPDRHTTWETTLRSYLLAALPDYMEPAFFIRLDRMPLTPGGKIDRQRLPRPDQQRQQDYIAPRSKVEKELAAIWAAVLQMDVSLIGVGDNFFRLGGHSLKATILVSRIHKQLGVKLPLNRIFKSPRISALAEDIRDAKRESYTAIPVACPQAHYPLSSAQKRLYFLQQMAPTSTSYNMPLFLPLKGKLDAHRWESALVQLIHRHESLRTSFIKVDDTPMQRVHEEVDFKLRQFDCSPHSGNGLEEIAASFVRPFELDRAPLLRSALVHSHGSYTWLVDIHHIVSDGTSQAVLKQELSALYLGHTLTPLTLQYKDFSMWQNRLMEQEALTGQLDYWLNLYKGDIPRLNIPADFVRPEQFSFAGDRVSFILEGEFIRLAQKHGATLFMNMLAALNVLFYKYTHQEDII
ncbi:MAG: amino acid adenylation domain-containing protein, partial [bacterium]|nr:amino acid adenylation domain-containing protein [bacterium]